MRPLISALLLALLVAPAAAQCTDGLKSIVEAQGKTWTVLTMEQWEFLRGVSAAVPGMPEGLPPGDGAALVMAPGVDYGYVVFTDGVSACLPIMPMPKELIDMTIAVGKGDVTHAGHGL